MLAVNPAQASCKVPYINAHKGIPKFSELYNELRFMGDLNITRKVAL